MRTPTEVVARLSAQALAEKHGSCEIEVIQRIVNCRFKRLHSDTGGIARRGTLYCNSLQQKFKKKLKKYDVLLGGGNCFCTVLFNLFCTKTSYRSCQVALDIES
jgi:hypothetical protein